eukprot:6863250-Ditylum_brightwellii.AAC.1
MEQRGKGRNALIITPTHNTVRSMLILPKFERKQQQQQHQYRLLVLKQHQPTLLLYQQPRQDRQDRQNKQQCWDGAG